MALDWQTAVVTLVALAAAIVVVRRFVPARRRSSARPGAPATPVACDHCETGGKAIRSASTGNGSAARTQTTPVVSLEDLRSSAKRH
jgi:hypothetical protein